MCFLLFRSPIFQTASALHSVQVTLSNRAKLVASLLSPGHLLYNGQQILHPSGTLGWQGATRPNTCSCILFINSMHCIKLRTRITMIVNLLDCALNVEGFWYISIRDSSQKETIFMIQFSVRCLVKEEACFCVFCRLCGMGWLRIDMYRFFFACFYWPFEVQISPFHRVLLQCCFCFEKLNSTGPD